MWGQMSHSYAEVVTHWRKHSRKNSCIHGLVDLVDLIYSMQADAFLGCSVNSALINLCSVSYCAVFRRLRECET